MDEDYQLVKRFQQGDVAAFEELVKKYQDRVFNVISHFTGERQDIEDLAQDVFIKVYGSLMKFKFKANFYSWLYRITMNVCIDEMRKRKLRRFLSLEGLSQWALTRLSLRNPQNEISAEEALEEKELSAAIQRGLNRLKNDHRSVIILRDIEGLSYEEISEVLGCSLGTVKSRLYRARAALRQHLKPYMEDKL